MRHSSLEALEARIAPATLLPGNKILQYQDKDGDTVKIIFSKPVAEGDFTFSSVFNDTLPQELNVIDFSNDTALAGINISMAVTKGPAGDGLANIGHLFADGISLGVVTIKGDLGRVNADALATGKMAIKTLSVYSMGAYGLSTQGGAGTLTSNLDGDVGALIVKGSLFNTEINVREGGLGKGDLTALTVGGSIIGGSNSFSGQIFTVGKIGTVKIGGSIVGGSAGQSGQINAGASIGSITLGGSLLGGGGGTEAGGLASASGAIISGRIATSESGAIGAILIKGSIVGGSGFGSGSIQQAIQNDTLQGNLGSLTVLGHVAAGSGDNSGKLAFGNSANKIVVKGSLVGSSGSQYVEESLSGQIFVRGNTASVSIGGDVRANGAYGDGGMRLEGTLGALTVGGSVAPSSGQTIFLTIFEKVGAIKVGGDFGNTQGEVLLRVYENVASFTVGGSMVGASLAVDVGQLGAVKVGGDVSDSLLNATGKADSAATNLAIKSIFIGGSLVDSEVRGGWSNFSADNPDATLGPISILGDVRASSISSGAEWNPASQDPVPDGVVATPTSNFADTALLSRIASITIGGGFYGTAANDGVYGFIAQQIGSLKISGISFAPTTFLFTLESPTLDTAFRLLPA